MTDMLGSGETRVYFLENLPDPAAPTRAQLEAGTDVTEFMSDLRFAEDQDAVPPILPPFSQTITFTIRVDTREFRRAVRELTRNFRRFERALRRGDPRLSAMHADYARRRKARGRRR